MLAALLAVLVPTVVAGCGSEQSVSPTPAASTAGSAPATPAYAPPGRKRTVLLDPGHNGGNATHPKEIAKKVPDGRGKTKPCNTTGTGTEAGLAEYKFNWDVALRVREMLISNGVNVVLTRENNTGVGPCVDERGKMAAEVNADALVSIHADGADPEGHGFHVAYPRPALNSAQGAPSLALATALRDALSGAGLPTSTYLGKNGLAPRSDLAGLNLSKRPAVLVECANMHNPEEAVTVSNGAGRQRYAQAIAIGILEWLKSPASESSSSSASASKSSSARAKSDN